MSREGIIQQLSARGISVHSLVYSQLFVSVYQGQYQNFPAAVKVIPIGKQSSQSSEFAALNVLRHINILSLYDFCQVPGTEYLVVVTEWASKDLAKDISQRKQNQFSWGEDELWKTVRQIIDGFAYMQEQGIAHRDVKPQNIFISIGGVVKIGDFDCAIKAGNHQAELSTVGTVMYMSPAVRRATSENRATVVHNPYKSDVYSLGLTILAMALLSPPNYVNRPDIPEQELWTLVNSINYSDFLKTLIWEMLRTEESDRPDFKALKLRLCPEIKEPFEVEVASSSTVDDSNVPTPPVVYCDAPPYNIPATGESQGPLNSVVVTELAVYTAEMELQVEPLPSESYQDGGEEQRTVKEDAQEVVDRVDAEPIPAPVEDLEVLSDSQSPAVYSQPPAVYSQSPADYSQPPIDYLQASADYMRPPADYSQPPADSLQSPAVYSQSPADYSQSPADYSQPPAVYSQSPAVYSQPPIDYLQAPADYMRPPADYSQPPADSLQPSAVYWQPPIEYREDAGASSPSSTKPVADFGRGVDEPEDLSSMEETAKYELSSVFPLANFEGDAEAVEKREIDEGNGEGNEYLVDTAEIVLMEPQLQSSGQWFEGQKVQVRHQSQPASVLSPLESAVPSLNTPDPALAEQVTPGCEDCTSEAEQVKSEMPPGKDEAGDCRADTSQRQSQQFDCSLEDFTPGAEQIKSEGTPGEDEAGDYGLDTSKRQSQQSGCSSEDFAPRAEQIKSEVIPGKDEGGGYELDTPKRPSNQFDFSWSQEGQPAVAAHQSEERKSEISSSSMQAEAKYGVTDIGSSPDSFEKAVSLGQQPNQLSEEQKETGYFHQVSMCPLCHKPVIGEGSAETYCANCKRLSEAERSYAEHIDPQYPKNPRPSSDNSTKARNTGVCGVISLIGDFCRARKSNNS